MSSRVILDGLAELREALRQLPAGLAQDGTELVDGATERAAASLVQAYPLGDTGNLRAGVRHSVTSTKAGVVGVVKSTSPHAHLWEFGTQNRHTRQGWNRGREGRHDPPQGLVAIAQRERRRLNAELVDLVAQAGFQVTGAL